jgi:hypothetical protein
MNGWISWKLSLFALVALRTVIIDGCGEYYPPPFDNQPPVVRLSNAPPDDPALDTAGNTGLWNAGTDDIGSDGLRDEKESGCTGTFDGIWNPDPAFDNYDPYGMDLCPPDSGSVKNDRERYTEKNGMADPGEPHVKLPSLLPSSRIRLDWSGLDGDGYITAFMYRWTYKEHYSDSEYTVRPWVTIINHLAGGPEELILLLAVRDIDIPAASFSVFTYFVDHDRYPGRLDPASPDFDSAYASIIRRLADGDTVVVNRHKVFASNPDTERYPVHETPYSGTFTFESNDVQNHHTFEIRAIDNESCIGSSDTVRFWTPRVEPPRVRILYSLNASPNPTDTIYVLPAPTATWPGIQFTFQGSDRNSRGISYSWRVDSGGWSPFSPGGVARISAADLDTPYNGRHLLRVRARNDFGAITPDSLQPVALFNTMVPEFSLHGHAERVLIVSVNKNPAAGTVSRGCPAESTIIRYYDEIFSHLGIPHDIYNPRGKGHPSLRGLAQYSTVYLVADNPPPGDISMFIPASRYATYAGAGGTIMMNAVAYSLLLSVFTNNPETLLVSRFRIRDLNDPLYGGTFQINREFDCAGALPVEQIGYPRLEVDTSKCDPDTGAITTTSRARAGGIRYVSSSQPEGFARTIYRFDSKRDSVDFENVPMGIRYIGSTYRTVWFGIPLYFVKQDQAREAIRKAMNDLGYGF